MSPNRHSTMASELSMTGAPVMPCDQPTPSNLSPPEMAKERQSASWCSPRILTQKLPALAMRGQLVELRAGARMTIGGSSERAAKDWQLKPTGMPSSSAVTMVTPVAKWPSTSRNRAWSRPDISVSLLGLAEIDRLGLVRGRDVFDGLGLGEAAGLIQNAVELPVGVRGVVVGEEQALGPRLGGYVHRVGGGRMAPVRLGREL